MSARVVKVTGYVSTERRLDADSEWVEIVRYPEDMSIEMARNHMNRIEPVIPTAEHRLTYTRIETVKEVVK